ncbi:hypothetical protein BD324DRAFT_651130 [Kockovaella imperatae]|uniref:Uncharacterized protein n=1 Tax=Kockovaella imperatae TaxID=4999 RepID=A0A1Y1UGK7_9TREE|nr:hypothetical protein BD324DRAFT_651130 [Kockovaella imperatae]ORX36644.1 hypothetical protein BD324DRAFT_651130 [Kockovaella imperatae]
MRILLWQMLLIALRILPSAIAHAATNLAPRQDSSSSDTPSTTAVSSEVAFLQTLQMAQITSFSCVITLVNMTTTPIGNCLGLTTLAQLILNPSTNASFSTQLNTYLGGVCANGQCSNQAIAEAKGQLAGTCQSGTNNTLISVLDAILDNYSNSYFTLACKVHFNGTADLCLPASLNTSQNGNNNDFFNSLVTGDNLDAYSQSVFGSSQCTGCIHEMYKAAVYTLSKIRGQPLTESFGNHLQNDCQGQGGNIDWTNVQDQQIPDALQVQQATPGQNGGSIRQSVVNVAILSLVCLVIGGSVLWSTDFIFG